MIRHALSARWFASGLPTHAQASGNDASLIERAKFFCNPGKSGGRTSEGGKRLSWSVSIFLWAIPFFSCAAQDATSLPEGPASSVIAVPVKKEAAPWDRSKNEQPAGYVDIEFLWDEFDHRVTRLWVCRGVQTGKVVDNAFCESREKKDTHWPSKNVPPGWRGTL